MLTTPGLTPELTPAPDLRQAQYWLLTRLARPDLAVAPADADILVTPPNAAGPRLQIYIDAYRQRLIDCLKADYPGLLRLLGDDLFGLLAEGYIRSRPPRSASLYDLGAGFPGFLRQTQQGLAQQPALRLALDLARFERGWIETSRAAGLEKSGPGPMLPQPESRLMLPATTRPLLLRHALASLQALLQGDQAAPVAAANRPHYILLARRDYALIVREIDDWMYFSLRAASAGPRTLFDCARYSARRLGGEPAPILAKLLLWAPLAQQAQWLKLER